MQFLQLLCVEVVSVEAPTVKQLYGAMYLKTKYTKYLWIHFTATDA